jgi:hypothetical protein
VVVVAVPCTVTIMIPVTIPVTAAVPAVVMFKPAAISVPVTVEEPPFIVMR